MTENKFDVQAAVAAAVAAGRDFTKTTTGGGSYTPPPEGVCGLRFIAYIELGKQKKKVKGVEQIKEQVLLTFEVSGKNYPPRELEDGTKVPVRVTIRENLSDNEKANLIKIFKAMNYEGRYTHFGQMLGNAYRGRIVHSEWTDAQGNKRIDAKLRNDNGYTITAPVIELVDDEGDVTTKPMKVIEPISELRFFVWGTATKQMWASLYIEGEYEERKDDKGKVIAPARSKNRFQEQIMAAENWTGSPMQVLLDEGDPEIDADTPPPVAEKKTAPKGKGKTKPTVEPVAEAPKESKKAPAADPLEDLPEDDLEY